jgi:hypothetical protein
MTKQLLVVVVVAVVLSTVIGFTLGWVSNPQSANAATNADVVRQLKKLNLQMGALNTKTGDTQTSEGSVRGLLTIICDYTAPINCKPH